MTQAVATAGPEDERHMQQAIALAMDNARRGTWPFGAVLVRDGEVLAAQANDVDASCDPTAHAEIQAVRAACRRLGTTDLTGSVVYASGYPCPMCLTAMLLAGVRSVWFAYSNEDGAPYDLSAERGYEEIARPPQQRTMPLACLPVRPAGEDTYEVWAAATRRPA